MPLEQGNSLTIYQGEDKDITIAIAQREDDGTRGDPVDLSSASEVVVIFPTTSGTPIVKRMTLAQVQPIRAGAGIFQVSLTAADTVLLLVGDAIGIEVRYVINSFLTVCQLPGTLSVQPSLFPNVTI